jgi:hypothetical protein
MGYLLINAFKIYIDSKQFSSGEIISYPASVNPNKLTSEEKDFIHVNEENIIMK